MTPTPEPPHLLDLYSGAGGAAVGYSRTGFRVTGVDVRPMPRYPFEHFHMDAIEFLDSWDPNEPGTRPVFGWDAIHASPPCQGHSRTARFGNYVWPELVEPTRSRLDSLGVPYVIENVRGAPLVHDPYGAHGPSRWVTELCGCMFPGQVFTYRPRLFETNFPVVPPPHQEHVAKNAPLGRRPAPGEFMHVVGNPTGADESRRAMGIDWMQRRELCEAIPPPYTQYIGAFLMDAVTGVSF